MAVHLKQMSTKTAGVQDWPFWTFKTVFEYSYGQLKHTEEKTGHCTISLTQKKLSDNYKYER